MGALRFQAEVRHRLVAAGQRVASQAAQRCPADAMASRLLRPRTRCDSSGLGHAGNGREQPLAIMRGRLGEQPSKGIGGHKYNLRKVAALPRSLFGENIS
jgi:hypothetical protein